MRKSWVADPTEGSTVMSWEPGVLVWPKVQTRYLKDQGGVLGSRGSYWAHWMAKAGYWRDPCCIYVHMHVFHSNWLSPHQAEGGTG